MISELELNKLLDCCNLALAINLDSSKEEEVSFCLLLAPGTDVALRLFSLLRFRDAIDIMFGIFGFGSFFGLFICCCGGSSGVLLCVNPLKSLKNDK